jgi:aspartyl/asparaginyl beta-hydroxylase (cupin superfamily)
MAEPAASPPSRSLLYRVGKRARPAVDRVLATYSEVGDAPVFQAAQFPWTAALEAQWETVRAEATAVLGDLNAVPALHDVSPDHRRIAEPDRWRAYFLWGYGYRMAEHCEACPQTARLLAQVPGLNSAFFSILKPGAHIPRHRGVTKAILTCHLGLKTPAGGRCEMQVAGETVRWREGACAVFDDTYPHEVWNDTNDIRVVLLIQFRRPVRQPGKLVGDVFLAGVRHSPFVQEARRNVLAARG